MPSRASSLFKTYTNALCCAKLLPYDVQVGLIHASYSRNNSSLHRSQVMLAARVLWQRGIPSWAHPPTAWKQVLEQLGLWHPSVVGSMLPVAATLLLVRLP